MKNIKLILALITLSTSANVHAQTWQVIPSGTTKNLNSISFPSSTVGYIGGDDAIILKTINGGQSWDTLDLTNFPFVANTTDFIEVKFVSDLVGFVMSGPYSGTYKTIDGGLTWSLVDNIYACYNTALYFFDENNGFLGGGGCFSGEIINRLSNGVWAETNVTPQLMQGSSTITNFDFLNSNVGMATGNGNHFFQTTDGGNTWDTIPNGLDPTDSLMAILYHSTDTVLAAYRHAQTSGFGVLISFDGGLTWQDEMHSATFFYPNMNALEKSGNGRIYIGGDYSFVPGTNHGLIYESNGSINTFWNYEDLDESIRDLDSYGDSVVFAVGENGYIVVNQNPATLNLKEQNELEKVLIYPNPNKGIFNLELNGQTLDRIEIIDAQGRVVFTSVENFQQSKEINLSRIQSGVYFLNLFKDNNSAWKQFVIL